MISIEQWEDKKRLVRKYLSEFHFTMGFLGVCQAVRIAFSDHYKPIAEEFAKMYKQDTPNPDRGYFMGDLVKRNVQLRMDAWDLFCAYHEVNGSLRDLGVYNAET